MSQNARENSTPKHASKHAPMSEQKGHESPITGLSPDDPIDVTEGTGTNIKSPSTPTTTSAPVTRR